MVLTLIVLSIGCGQTANDVLADVDASTTPSADEADSAAEMTGCLDRLDGLPPGYRDDPRAGKPLIVVYKRQRKIGLYENGSLRDGACWDVALGSKPYAAKVRMDNASTPEGWYKVDHKRTSEPYDRYPHTDFGLALFVSYPNIWDVMEARRRGVIDKDAARELSESIRRGQLPRQNTAMGGSILIHAWPESMPATLGCVGVRNADMEKLFDLAEPGMNILILPWSQVIRANGTFSLDPPPPDP